MVGSISSAVDEKLEFRSLNVVNKPGSVTDDICACVRPALILVEEALVYLELELGGGLTLNQLLFCRFSLSPRLPRKHG